MDQISSGVETLGHARDVLFDVCRKAEKLAKSVEWLEIAHANIPDPVNSYHFHVASTMFTGLELDEPLDEHQLPSEMRESRLESVQAVLALRKAVHEAINKITACENWMDSIHESVDRRWTNRTIGELRVLLGAILRGHGRDAYPSALPMIRVGVPKAIRDSSLSIRERMEDVKTALLKGVGNNFAAPAILPELLVKLDARIAAVESKGVGTSANVDLAGRSARELEDKLGPVRKPDGWTRSELVAQVREVLGSFSDTTFNRIRDAAGLDASESGGVGQQRRFSRSDLRKLIEAAEVKGVKTKTFRYGAEIAKSWRELLAV